MRCPKFKKNSKYFQWLLFSVFRHFHDHHDPFINNLLIKQTFQTCSYDNIMRSLASKHSRRVTVSSTGSLPKHCKGAGNFTPFGEMHLALLIFKTFFFSNSHRRCNSSDDDSDVTRGSRTTLHCRRLFILCFEVLGFNGIMYSLSK